MSNVNIFCCFILISKVIVPPLVNFTNTAGLSTKVLFHQCLMNVATELLQSNGNFVIFKILKAQLKTLARPDVTDSMRRSYSSKKNCYALVL